jgi:hypothetical protein
MLRLIFLLLVFYVAFKLLKVLLLAALRILGRRPEVPGSQQASPTQLVGCSVCGTFFQERQGVKIGGQTFCSENCAHQNK